MGWCNSTTNIPPSFPLPSTTSMPSNAVTPHGASPDALRAPAVSPSGHSMTMQAPSPSLNGSNQRACETDPRNGETIAPPLSQASPPFAANAPVLHRRDIARVTKATQYVVLAPSPPATTRSLCPRRPNTLRPLRERIPLHRTSY